MSAAPDPQVPNARTGRGIILPASFYDRETEVVARALLGCILECRGRTGLAAGRIVETEAYLGEHDPACHAAVGRTPRTDPLYGPPGTFYVYFVYGAHWCCNTVTRADGLPSAVLIRAVEPLVGVAAMRARRPAARRDEDLTNGPGKVCAALGIDARHNRLSLQRPPVIIRAGDRVPEELVAVTPRIGVRRAAEWPLRWCVADSRWVSHALPPSRARTRPRIAADR